MGDVESYLTCMYIQYVELFQMCHKPSRFILVWPTSWTPAVGCLIVCACVSEDMSPYCSAHEWLIIKLCMYVGYHDANNVSLVYYPSDVTLLSKFPDTLHKFFGTTYSRRPNYMYIPGLNTHKGHSGWVVKTNESAWLATEWYWMALRFRTLAILFVPHFASVFRRRH